MTGPVEESVSQFTGDDFEMCFRNVHHLFLNVYFIVPVLVDGKQPNECINNVFADVSIPPVSGKIRRLIVVTPPVVNLYRLPLKCLSLIVLSVPLCAWVCRTEATDDEDTLPTHRQPRCLCERVQKPLPPLLVALID